MPFNRINTNNPWGAFAVSTSPSVLAAPFSGPAPATPYTPAVIHAPASSTGSSGVVATNPWPATHTTTSGGTGSVQSGGTTLLNAEIPTRSGQTPTTPTTPMHPSNPHHPNYNEWLAQQGIRQSPQDRRLQIHQEGGGNNGELTDMTQRSGQTTPLLEHLNLGLSGMRAAAARGSGVRSPFKQGGGSGGGATDLEKFSNPLLAMGSEYLGKNVAGFDQGGKYNMYDNGGGFYNKAQQMKAAIMDQAMQSGIVAAQLDNVRNANNNNATARDLVGRMRNFSRGGRF
tara:strand:- start:764 stop:1618 length:855 start_codon:yes stop_codon:yes gene_type:complete